MITVRACERLGLTPAEWNAIPYPQQCDFLEVWRADKAIEQDKKRNPKAPRNR